MNFKTLRERSGLDVKGAIEILHTTERNLRKWECSDRMPKLKTVQAMKEAYDCRWSEIMEAYNTHYSVYIGRKGLNLQ